MRVLKVGRTRCYFLIHLLVHLDDDLNSRLAHSNRRCLDEETTIYRFRGAIGALPVATSHKLVVRTVGHPRWCL